MIFLGISVDFWETFSFTLQDLLQEGEKNILERH